MNKDNKNKLSYCLVMCTFGALGPVVKAVGLPSGLTAFYRAFFAALFLILFVLVIRRNAIENVREYVIPMIVAGILITTDWMGLFEAYNYVSVATATICYYTAPIFVLLESAIFLKEKFTFRHLVCAVFAFAGIILVSGGFDVNNYSAGMFKGILLSLLGAVSYATIVVINKKYPKGNRLMRASIQLSAAAIAYSPYVLLKYRGMQFDYSAKTLILLLVLGILMTAVTYILYYDLVVKIPSRTVAILAYADPVVAVLLSWIILREPLTLSSVLGAVMVIVSAIASELK